MLSELKRIIDQISRDKGIDRQLLVEAIEEAVMSAAKKKYGVVTMGYELNFLAYAQARLLSLYYKGIHIQMKNFFEADISHADVIFCYLYPDVMPDLSAKLIKELKAGAIIASCNFRLPGFTPYKVLRPEGSLHYDPIFLYKNKIK